MRILTVLDIIVGPLIMIIVLIIAYSIRVKKYRNNPISKYFIPALVTRFFGTILIAVIFQFLYGYGDTFAYFGSGKRLFHLFFTDPPLAIEFIFSSADDVNYEFRKIVVTRLAYGGPTIIMLKITGLLSFLGLGSYIGIAIVMGFYAFMGVWYLFITFYKIYPHYYKELALSVLFIPSVIIWGTGIFKDTICIGAVGFITYSVYNIFFAKRKILFFTVILLFNSVLLFEIKDYILVLLAPSLLIWVFLRLRKSIKNKNVRLVLGGTMFIIGLGVTALFLQKISSFSNSYSMDTILGTAEKTQVYLEYITKDSGGTGYTLGDIEFTPIGLIKLVPKAINVTLFRPYIWEARKVINIPAALESLVFLLFTLYVVFYKVGFFKTFKMIFSNPDVLFCLSFALLFAFAVGLTSYNYGTLVRYKIPCLPFYLIALVIIWKSDEQEKTLKKAKHSARMASYQSHANRETN